MALSGLAVAWVRCRLVARGAAALVALVLAGPPAGAAPGAEGRWERVLPAESAGAPRRVWARTADDAWAVGDAGTVLRWDGRRWSRLASGTTAALEAVWAASGSVAWAVGGDGTILRWDGSRWRPAASGTTRTLRCVWGASATDVWAAGDGGTILHFDGARWSAATPEDAGRSFAGVWGSAPDDVWVVGGRAPFMAGVGSEGVIVHWDGRAWSEAKAEQPFHHLHGVWGRAADDVWAVGAVIGRVGSAANIVHWDGRGWSAVPDRWSPARPLYAVWGGAEKGVLGAGDGGITPIGDSAGERGDLGMTVSLAGADASDVWAVTADGRLAHWDGRVWRPAATGDLDVARMSFGGVWGSSASDVWVVGGKGDDRSDELPDASIIRWDGSGWTVAASGQDHLSSVWGSWERDVWAGARRGRGGLLHWDGLAWSRDDRVMRLAGGSGQIHATWGTSRTDVWAVGNATGNASGALVLHWDGKRWSKADVPTSEGESLYAIWGSAAGDVWAVGGQALTGGSRRIVLHWDGRQWSRAARWTEGVAGSGYLHCAWGSSAQDVWAAGSGAILHWDGQRWSKVRDGPYSCAMWGFSATNVWLVGSGGTTLRWDGSRWARVPSPSQETLWGVWGSAPEDVWAVGEKGTVLRYRPGGGQDADRPAPVSVQDADGKPIDGLQVAARARPGHELAGLSRFVEAKGDAFVFSGRGAGYRERPATVTVAGAWTRSPSAWCWAPRGQRATITGANGRQVAFTSEGEYVASHGASRRERSGSLTFRTHFLTECILVDFSGDDAEAWRAERASVQRMLGVSDAEASAARRAADAACAARNARRETTAARTPAAAPAEELQMPRPEPLAGLLDARGLSALLPQDAEISGPAAGPARRPPGRDGKHPVAAFGPDVAPFPLAWRIDPARADDMFREHVSFEMDPCPARNQRGLPISSWHQQELTGAFLELSRIQAMESFGPADAAGRVGGSHVFEAVAREVSIREVGPFFELLEDRRVREGATYFVREVAHRLVLKRSAVEDGRFRPGARDGRTLAAVLDAFWYATGLPPVEAVAARETARHVVRDYRVALFDGDQTCRALLRFVLDRSDGTLLLIPAVLDANGKRIGPTLVADLSAGVGYL